MVLVLVCFLLFSEFQDCARFGKNNTETREISPDIVAIRWPPWMNLRAWQPYDKRISLSEMKSSIPALLSGRLLGRQPKLLPDSSESYSQFISLALKSGVGLTKHLFGNTSILLILQEWSFSTSPMKQQGAPCFWFYPFFVGHITKRERDRSRGSISVICLLSKDYEARKKSLPLWFWQAN